MIMLMWVLSRADTGLGWRGRVTTQNAAAAAGMSGSAGGGGEVEVAGGFGQLERGEDGLVAGGERGALGDPVEFQKSA